MSKLGLVFEFFIRALRYSTFWTTETGRRGLDMQLGSSGLTTERFVTRALEHVACVSSACVTIIAFVSSRVAACCCCATNFVVCCQVTLDEFIDGIMRCKGPARAIDQVAMHADLKQLVSCSNAKRPYISLKFKTHCRTHCGRRRENCRVPSNL